MLCHGVSIAEQSASRSGTLQTYLGVWMLQLGSRGTAATPHSEQGRAAERHAAMTQETSPAANKTTSESLAFHGSTSEGRTVLGRPHLTMHAALEVAGQQGLTSLPGSSILSSDSRVMHFARASHLWRQDVVHDTAVRVLHRICIHGPMPCSSGHVVYC